jgi:hypothetical protein
MADGAQRVIDFLTETLDATPLRRFDLPDGSIMHAEIQIDDSVVMIADSGGAFPSFPVWLHVYVPDVDASYRTHDSRRRSFRGRSPIRKKATLTVAPESKIRPVTHGGSRLR